MSDYIRLKNPLKGFTQTDVEVVVPHKYEAFQLVSGILEDPPVTTCPECGNVDVSRIGSGTIWLRDIPYGSHGVAIHITRGRFLCRSCGRTFLSPIPFKDPDHNITVALSEYIVGLLISRRNLKEISRTTHVDANIIKAMDKKRLLALYTDGKGHLLPPDRRSRFIAVDEFRIHSGHVYATMVISLDDGSVLYLAHGKTKEALMQFLSLAGDEWMAGVEAVACDMNSNYELVFMERYSHMAIVYDRFHIIKYFNDRVVAEVRKDIERRLVSEGRKRDARSLKGSKYLLCSNMATLERKDSEEGGTVVPASSLFSREERKRKGGHADKYRKLIAENHLLFVCDLIKEDLSAFFSLTDEAPARKALGAMIGICYATGDPHFRKFGDLLRDHRKGILSHAKFKISSGMIEGVNNRTRTMIKDAYGFHDDDYLFLKILDSSRHRK